ncbi:MAG: hypothetical protein EPN48_01990 [Microbacteriaceae bacterium]|nr:MAG: hypothetical protein EPN48_01990 [Microbacteriaceae bacterium]
MRKYLLNGSVLGAVFGAWSVIQSTRRGPRNRLLLLVWLSWALSLAVAIETVREKSREADDRARLGAK